MSTAVRNVSAPSLSLPPRASVREWIVERYFRAAAGKLPIRVAFPGGERVGRGGPDSPVMRVVRPEHLFRRMASAGPIGFGEAYMAGDWISTDLAALLTPFAARLNRPVSFISANLRTRLGIARPAAERNTIEGACANIHQHYDLSNEFFALFLDESMTYSCAEFGVGDDLHRAQIRKIDSILDRAGVTRGTRLLELGSGWGELAVRAACRGAEVTTITLSQEQRRAVEERAKTADVSDRVHVLLQDYRELDGQYDAVVSVEMIEGVGAEYWVAYFAALDRLLVPGGMAVLQAITMPHDRMLVNKDVRTWVQKYVFPGGQVLSTRALDEEISRTTLQTVARRRLGHHYARTLSLWRERFDANQGHVAELGFDGMFQRMWHYYLAYSEAGFRAAFLDVWQLCLFKRTSLPATDGSGPRGGARSRPAPACPCGTRPSRMDSVGGTGSPPAG